MDSDCFKQALLEPFQLDFRVGSSSQKYFSSLLETRYMSEAYMLEQISSQH